MNRKVRHLWQDPPGSNDLVASLHRLMEEFLNQYDDLTELFNEDRFKSPEHGQFLEDNYDLGLTMHGNAELFFWIIGHPDIRKYQQQHRKGMVKVGEAAAILRDALEGRGEVCNPLR